jgi:hypothetical protein
MQAESPGQQRKLIVTINTGYIHSINHIHAMRIYYEFLAISFYTYSLKIHVCEEMTLT